MVPTSFILYIDWIGGNVNNSIIETKYLQYGVNPDERLARIIEGFARIREAHTNTRIGPYPMSQLLPMFYEDYFMYWGNLNSVKGENFVVRWLVPRITLFASLEQVRNYLFILELFFVG